MFEIVLFKGTDSIQIGMTAEEIEAIVLKKPNHIRKGGVENIVDEYEFGFIYFDNDNRCEGIEFFKPAKVMLNGKEILGLKTKYAKEIFLKLDSFLDIEGEDVFCSHRYSIGIYGEDGIVETIYVGKEGCYD